MNGVNQLLIKNMKNFKGCVKMTIAEVSKKYNLTQDTIRYYEKIGLIPHVPRTKSGIRDFDEDSCNWLEFIKCMRNAGLSIDILSKYISLFKQGDKTVKARKDLLVEQREKLLEKQENIKKTIKRLDYKIEIYDDIISGKRKDFLERP